MKLFFKEKLEEAENDGRELESSLSEAERENNELRTKLESAEASIKDLEAQLHKRIQESSVASSAIKADGELIQTLRNAIREREAKLQQFDGLQRQFETEKEEILEKLLQAKEEAAKLRNQVSVDTEYNAEELDIAENEAGEEKRSTYFRKGLWTFLLLLFLIPVSWLTWKHFRSQPSVPPLQDENTWEQSTPARVAESPDSSIEEPAVPSNLNAPGVSLRRISELSKCLESWVQSRKKSSKFSQLGTPDILLRDIAIVPKEGTFEIRLLELTRLKNHTDITRKKLTLVQGPDGLIVQKEEALPIS